MKTKLLKKGNRDCEFLQILLDNPNKIISYRELLLATITNPIKQLLLLKEPKLFKKEQKKLKLLFNNLKIKFPELKSKIHCSKNQGYYFSEPEEKKKYFSV